MAAGTIKPRTLLAFLRGVNVGGNRRIRMEELRAVFTGLGLQHVQTYLQSGNVVFQTTAAGTHHDWAARLSEAIEESLQVRCSIVLRDLPELTGVVARHPWPAETDLDPSKLLVWFLASPIEPEALSKCLLKIVAPERAEASGSEIFLYFPDGMGRPKSPLASIERCLRVPVTGRNWNTVVNLVHLAQRLPHPA